MSLDHISIYRCDGYNYSISSLIKIQEFFLLGLGVILFGIVGALSLASIDSVPEDLVDNAAVLGALCLLTALVFIGDLLMSPPRKKDKQDEAKILEKGKDNFKFIF